MKKKILWIALIPVMAAGIGIYSWQKNGKSGRDVPFEAMKVERGDIESTILTTGVVEPQNRVEIKPAIAGRVEDILVTEGQTVHKGQILAWMSSSERAALLDSARIKGPREVERWADLYKPAPLVAPIDGTVIARNVEPGQSVTTADAILVISDRLIIKAQVDETDIGAVKVGQSAVATLDAYPSQIISSAVDHIAYEAKTVNNVTIYDVDVLPAEVPTFMRSGMTANVTFKTAYSTDALLVPAESVQQKEGRTVVLVPGRDGKRRPDRREVEIGISDGKRTEIVSGLDEGDEILVARARLPESRGGNSSNPFSPFGGGRQRGVR